MGSVLYLDCVDGHMTVHTCQNTQNFIPEGLTVLYVNYTLIFFWGGEEYLDLPLWAFLKETNST